METVTKPLTAVELLQALDILDGRPLRDGERQRDLNSPEEVEFFEVWSRTPTSEVESNDERGTRTVGGELYFRGWRIMGREHGLGWWRRNLIGYATQDGSFYQIDPANGERHTDLVVYPLGGSAIVQTPEIPTNPPRELLRGSELDKE